MKKAFSLMELVIAVALLSFVMVSLIQIRTSNINLISKLKEKSILKDYVILAIDFDGADNKNENIRLGDKYKFENNEVRKELKDKKVKRKDKKIDTIDLKLLNTFRTRINIFSSKYSIDNKIENNIYSFKIRL